YTPGPLYALAALTALAGPAALLRHRADPATRHLAQATLTLLTAAAAILLVSDAFEFSWRYQLPALITLPPASALAITIITRSITTRRSSAGETSDAALAER
ncbi:MAG TPA: hypothetical protein VH307_06580, partial [Streptosporangiaceae bacterium]|nr:hypothetical protein [Streptosporangiaceae bacterium]